MPLKAFKTKDEIPEELRETALALADGTFAIVEEVDTSDLQKELTDWKRKHDAAERLAKKAAADLSAQQTAAKAHAAGVTGEELAKIRAEVKTEVLAEFDAQLKKGEAALSENRQLKLDNRVKSLAAENGVRAERLPQWWKLHGDKFDLTDDGTAIVRDKPGTTIAKFITSACREESPEFYVGSQASGSGASSANGAPGGGAPKIDVLLNPSAALAVARAAGRTE